MPDRSSTNGVLLAGRVAMRCAVGRSGLRQFKREGDGATPIGEYPLRRLFYRSDRVARPSTPLPAVAIGPDMGWCDDTRDPRYNRLIALPARCGHERLWRDDHLYDLLLVIGHNDAPPVSGKGSAIFLHLARDDYAPTEGCVAISGPHMSRLLPRLGPRSVIRIG